MYTIGVNKTKFQRNHIADGCCQDIHVIFNITEMNVFFIIYQFHSNCSISEVITWYVVMKIFSSTITTESMKNFYKKKKMSIQ